MTTTTHSGGVNLGNDNKIDRIDTIIANNVGTELSLNGVPLDQIRRLLRDEQERPQRWRALVEQLAAMRLEVGADMLCDLYAALWPDAELPDAPMLNGSALFQAMVLARMHASALVDPALPVFAAALARLMGEQVRVPLQPWLVRAQDELELDAAQHERLLAAALDSYARFAGTRPSLLVEIKPARAQTGEQPLYRLRVGVARPGFRTRLLFPNRDEDSRDMALAEIKRTVGELRRPAALPPWAQGLLTIELLLPVRLIQQLRGEWRFDQWSYEEIQELDEETRFAVQQRLDLAYPLVVRLCDRRRQAQRMGAPWADKWSYLAGWLNRTPRDPHPLIISPRPGSPRYVDPQQWGSPHLVALVQSDPIDPDAPLQPDHWLAQLILKGMPVAIWPLPGADAMRCDCYLDTLDPDGLRELPHRLLEARRKPDPAVPASDLVLFWDDYERYLAEEALSDR
ncbi:MAG: hypothetical protein OHK0022_21230 [Roseiflexaceae bacterium]